MKTGGVRTHLAATALFLGLVAACGGTPEAGQEPTTSARPTDQMTHGPSDAMTDLMSDEPSMSESGMVHGTTVMAGDSDFGTVLFDDTGQAIYLFDVETTLEPKCYGACEEAWPPVLTDGEPVAGDGIDPTLVGITERTDGTTQVTYANHPLYFYAHEGKNEVKCHDVFMNGGNWYVVRPDGTPAPPR